MLVVKTLALILEQGQALEEKLGKLLRLPNWHRGGKCCFRHYSIH